MLNRIYLIVMGVIMLPLFSLSQTKVDKPILILKDVNLIDVVHKTIQKNSNILIVDGIIKKISQTEIKNANAKIINLKGKYLIPGLIDAHVHISNMLNETRADRVKHLEYYLKGGITTLRDCAGDARILAELKRAVFTGKINGPDIYYSAFMAGPSYYSGNRDGRSVVGLGTKFSPWLQCLEEGDNLDKAMIEAKACGATGVKLYAGFSPSFLKQVAIKANEYDLEVWGHITPFSAIPSDAVNAGMKVLSHAHMMRWEQITVLEDEESIMKNFEKHLSTIDPMNPKLENVFNLMKDKNSILDATLHLAVVNGMEFAEDYVKQAYEAGVKVCAGTDCINDFTKSLPFLYDELDLYVNKCGFTPIDAIRSATIIAAEAIGIENETGSIEEGKKADLIILNANPLTDFNNIRKIDMVIRKGIIVN